MHDHHFAHGQPLALVNQSINPSIQQSANPSPNLRNPQHLKPNQANDLSINPPSLFPVWGKGLPESRHARA
jgi:hypothetical protein